MENTLLCIVMVVIEYVSAAGKLDFICVCVNCPQWIISVCMCVCACMCACACLLPVA